MRTRTQWIDLCPLALRVVEGPAVLNLGLRVCVEITADLRRLVKVNAVDSALLLATAGRVCNQPEQAIRLRVGGKQKTLVQNRQKPATIRTGQRIRTGSDFRFRKRGQFGETGRCLHFTLSKSRLLTVTPSRLLAEQVYHPLCDRCTDCSTSEELLTIMPVEMVGPN